jgi:hypothetical protein
MYTRIARCNMEKKFLLKMLRKSFLQYGRHLDEDPLSNEDYIQLMKKITNTKDDHSEWYEVVEDVVYGYLTNQE